MKSQTIQTLLSFFIVIGIAVNTSAQTQADLQAKEYIISQEGIFKNLALSANELVISASHTGTQNQVSNVYFQQIMHGIEIFGAVGSVHINSEGEVIHATSDLIDLRAFKIAKSERVDVAQAIAQTAHHFKIDLSAETKLVSAEKSANKSSVSLNISLARDDINSKLVYVVKNNVLRLAWNVSFEKADDGFWWNVRVDAATGEIIDKNSWTVECNFDHIQSAYTTQIKPRSKVKKVQNLQNNKSIEFAPDSYRVFALPLEAPTEGAHTLVVDPADPTASPFGWHDTTGVAGHEFTDTRGNNVFAQDDLDFDNSGGFRPSGGGTLDFDFPADTSMAPSTYLSAAIVNLFYWNNIMHDITYRYGFDEAAGNFQENNYGNGGLGSDHVWADAQDGSGTNNANFLTLPDGSNPRMQMFEWIVSISDFELTSGAAAGNYNSAGAGFGPQNAGPISEMLVLSEPADGCAELTNAAAINGHIAVIDRGTCQFDNKVGHAQTAGALAVIVCNNVPGSPITMAPGDDGIPAFPITIPSAMISLSDCDVIKPTLPANATVQWNGSHTDSDFDNGIIAHEYGHGISNRLTGGAANVGCLGNDEQMGEGWSDFFGMILTMHPGDLGSDGRGVGTYVQGEPLTGQGIRAYRYSTDMNINPHTYDDIITTGTSPHALGTVWNTMLWDMTWLLIDKHGFNANIYDDWTTGGNNLAIQLVMDGLKLQPCSPGFVDGRDAILAADLALTGGNNSCEIWTAFARRGLGVSALQGSSSDRTDGTEAFDLPGGCDLNLCTSQDRTYNDETIPDGTDEKANDFIKTTGTVDVTAGTSVSLSAKNNIDVDGIFTAEDGSSVQMKIDDTCKAFGIPGSFGPETPTKSKILVQNNSK